MASQPDGQLSRRALLVATETYNDATLRVLRSPGKDAHKLTDVLADPAIGRFDVTLLLDAPSDQLKRAIVRFCSEAGPDDLILLYLSCHGVLDDRGRLYYASVDTERELLSASAIRADWLNEQLEDSRSRRQVVVLDCCHSGAFAKGAKGDGALALEQRFEGRGRIVLTASRATEYSFEGAKAVGEGATSVFTAAVVNGLRTGDADVDQDGVVTVADLYSYVYDRVREVENRQTPMLWTYAAEGNLVLARSPRGARVDPAVLPEHLRVALDSPAPRIREGAVLELADVLVGSDPAAALRARLTLEDVRSREIAQIVDMAANALESTDSGGGASVPVAEAGRSEPQPEPSSSATYAPSVDGIAQDGINTQTTAPTPAKARPKARAPLRMPTPPMPPPVIRWRVSTRTGEARGAQRVLLVACYLLATAAGTAAGCVIAKETLGFSTTRLAQVAFSWILSGAVFAAWFPVMHWAGHTRISRARTVRVVIAATLLAGLAGFATDIKTSRVELVVENVWFAVLFALSVGFVARARTILVVALTSGTVLGSAAALLVPANWLTEYTTTTLVKMNLVLNGAVVLVTALYLAFSGRGRPADQAAR